MSEETISDSEEEILVFAEFDETVNIANYRSIHLLGVDEKNPIIQMDGTFFSGTHENTLGTYMFFENDPNPSCQDPLFDKLPERNVKLVATTRKLLKMEHAYVTHLKPSAQDVSSMESESQVSDTKSVSFSTLPEALEHFKNEFESSRIPTTTNTPDSHQSDSKKNKMC